MAEDKSKMVDIDTSGDEVEVVLDENKKKQRQNLTVKQKNKLRSKRFQKRMFHVKQNLKMN